MNNNLSSLNDALVAHYKLSTRLDSADPEYMNDFGSDSVGKGGSTISDGIVPSTDTPRYALSANFANNTKGMTLLNNPITETTTDFSISLWVKFSQLESTIWQCLVTSKPNYQSGLSIFCHSSVVRFDVGNLTDFRTSFNYNFTIDKWYHLVAIKTNTFKKLYINGVEIGSVELASNSAGMLDTLLLGIDEYWPFNGKLSDFRIYNRVLTEDEINLLYKTSALITDDNQMYGYEFVEENNTNLSIDDKGVVKSQEFETVSRPILGKSEQITYTGKNLCNAIMNVTLSSGSEQWRGLLLSTENTGITWETGKTYYIKAFVDAPQSNETAQITNYNYATIFNYAQSLVYNGKIPEIRIGANTLNAAITNEEVKIMVSTDPITDWEPYVGGIPSPNPDYPQEIKTVQGVTNYFNINEVIRDKLLSQTDGKTTSVVRDYGITPYISITPNKNYYIKCNNINMIVRIFYYDSNYNFIASNTSNNTFSHATAHYIRLQGYLGFFDNNFILSDKNILDYVPFGTWLKQIAKDKNGNINTALIDMNKPNILENYSLIKGTPYIRGDSNNKGVTISENFKLRANTIYTFKTDLDISKYKYGVILNTNPLPSTSATTKYDSGWRKLNEFRFTPTTDTYFGITFVNNDISINLPVSEMEKYHFELYEGSLPYYEFAEAKDTKDIFKSGVLNNKINKFILTGDEDLRLLSDVEQGRRFDIKVSVLGISTPSSNYNAICSHLINTGYTNNKREHGYFYLSSSWLVINDTDNYWNSLEDFKAWLKEQHTNGTPVTFYYQLAEPTTYYLQQIQEGDVIDNPSFIEVINKYNLDVETYQTEPGIYENKVIMKDFKEI